MTDKFNDALVQLFEDADDGSHKYLTFSKSKRGGVFINFISPAGTAIFPKLVEADEYEGKSSWKTRLAVPAAEAEEFIDELQPLLSLYEEVKYLEADAKKKKDYKNKWDTNDLGEEELDDNGDPTGNILFNFGKNAFSAKGVAQSPPALFDSFNQMADVTDIWSGSKLRIAGFLYFYDMASTKKFGVATKMQGVQIIELVAPGAGGRSAESMGFGKVEGGFGGSVSKDDEIDTGDEDGGDDEAEF